MNVTGWIRSKEIGGKYGVFCNYTGLLIDIQYAKNLISSLQEHIENFTEEEIELFNKVKEEQDELRGRNYLKNVAIEKQSEEDKSFVYLMIDNRNGLYKIGKSKDPSKREKTLQSEVPSVELVFKCNGYTELESKLHKKFADKRVRGEWFKLDKEDVEHIKQIA